MLLYSFYFAVPDVDCEWTDWSDWTACSVTCDEGSKIRIRAEKTAQSGNGKQCDGDSEETDQCTLAACSEWEIIMETINIQDLL